MDPNDLFDVEAPRRKRWGRVWGTLIALLCAAALAFAVGAWIARPTAVTAARLVRGTAIDAAYATGTVEAMDRVDVKATINGTVRELSVKVGQVVKRGDVLARISNAEAAYELKRGQADSTAAAAHAGANAPQLAALAARWRGAQAEFESAQAELVRAQRLAESEAASETALEQARTRAARAESFLRTNEAEQRALRIDLRANSWRQAAMVNALAARFDGTIIRAPMDGIVLRRMIDLGEVVVLNQVLFRVGDGSGLILEVLVDEADVAQISDGTDGRPASKVGATLYAFPNQVFAGSVFELLPDADRDRKAFLARIRLSAPPAGLRSGMTAEVNIIRSARENALLAPLEAVSDNRVWVIQNGRLELRTVETGLRDALRVEIRTGLRDDEIVVVSDTLALKSGTRVTSSLQMSDELTRLPDSAQSAKEQR